MTNLPKTLAILNEGLLANGGNLHIGAQLHVRLHGQILFDHALGLARLAKDSPDGRDTPMTPDTLMLFLSAGKPLTAAAILLLTEQNLLNLDEPVAAYLPEFAQNGKENITIRHLLTHTAPLRLTDPSYPFTTWHDTLNAIFAAKPERHWPPGMKAGYSVHTNWYLLGELVNRLTHTSHDQYIREKLLLPLDMTDTHLAMTPETYHTYADRIGYLYDTSLNPPTPIPNYDTELAASRPRPSASARGPFNQLAHFFEMLANQGAFNGRQILQPDTVRAMTTRQRLGLFDQTFQSTIDWGLGIILNSAHYGPAIPYQFGPHASPNTFGHGGSQSSTAFHDPQHHLTVSLHFNGTPGNPQHDKRLRQTLKALYEDLGLA